MLASAGIVHNDGGIVDPIGRGHRANSWRKEPGDSVRSLGIAIAALRSKRDMLSLLVVRSFVWNSAVRKFLYGRGRDQRRDR